MTLKIYLAKQFLNASLRVFLFFAALIMIIDGLERMRRYAGRNENYTSLDAFLTTFFALPGTMVIIFPLIVLLGSMIMISGLNRGSELVVMRAAGVSAMRVMRVPMGLSFIIGILISFVFNGFITDSRQFALDYEAKMTGRPTELVKMTNGGFWIRDERDGESVLTFATTPQAQNSTISNLRQYIENQDGKLVAIRDAKSAFIDSGTWQLRNGKETRFTEGAPIEDRFEDYSYESRLDFSEIFQHLLRPERIKVYELPSYIRDLSEAGFQTVNAEIYLYTEILRPFMYVIMAMIGSVFAFANPRKGELALRVIIAVSCGFAFFTLAKFSESLGRSEAITPVLATIGPIAFAFLLVSALFLYLEDG